MTHLNRSAADPSEVTGEDHFGVLIETATGWAHTAGRRLAEARRWVETQAVEERPLSTMGVAFGLGALTGWLIKRR